MFDLTFQLLFHLYFLACLLYLYQCKSIHHLSADFMAWKMAPPEGSDVEEADPFLPSDEPQLTRPDASDKRRFRITILAFIFVFFIEAGIGMVIAPMTRLQEAIVCRQYYSTADPTVIPSSGEIAEDLCKNDIIQSELALVRGLSDLFDGLVGEDPGER